MSFTMFCMWIYKGLRGRRLISFTEEEFNKYLLDLERKGYITIDHEKDMISITEKGRMVYDIFARENTLE